MAGQQKTAYIVELIRDAVALAPIMDKLADRNKEYFDNGYNSGGADQIADADVATYDITAAEFTNYITLMGQLNNFFTNSAVTTGDYGSTINKLRRAPNI